MEIQKPNIRAEFTRSPMALYLASIETLASLKKLVSIWVNSSLKMSRKYMGQYLGHATLVLTCRRFFRTRFIIT